VVEGGYMADTWIAKGGWGSFVVCGGYIVEKHVWYSVGITGVVLSITGLGRFSSLEVLPGIICSG
jgi:hypothetical protein